MGESMSMILESPIAGAPSLPACFQLQQPWLLCALLLFSLPNLLCWPAELVACIQVHCVMDSTVVQDSMPFTEHWSACGTGAAIQQTAMQPTMPLMSALLGMTMSDTPLPMTATHPQSGLTPPQTGPTAGAQQRAPLLAAGRAHMTALHLLRMTAMPVAVADLTETMAVLPPHHVLGPMSAVLLAEMIAGLASEPCSPHLVTLRHPSSCSCVCHGVARRASAVAR